ncbi:MAG: RHS repeat-associated core domain-containing protein, partial [Candidatus Saccharimonadales bacterium]
SESNTSIHHWAGFQGGHVDVDTAAIDDYFRWYDPPTAKWLSEDPRGFTAGDRDLTRYVGNSPTNGVDPSGLCPDYPSPPKGNAFGPNPRSAANGSWPVGFYGTYSGLTPQQMAYAAQVGCFGLMQMQLNMCAPNPARNANPYTAPGMNWFGSYTAAQQYQAQQAPAGPATMIAYQFNYGTGGWTPPTGGALSPQLLMQTVQSQGQGPGSGNWATLMSNASHQWYWQYMNQSNPGAIVYHNPFNATAANMGLPSGPSAMNTTIYAVYVPPPTPMPQPAPPPQPSGPGYWYYFQQNLQHVNPFNYFN